MCSEVLGQQGAIEVPVRGCWRTMCVNVPFEPERSGGGGAFEPGSIRCHVFAEERS